MLTRGPNALSDAELLALLLRTGIKGLGVLQLSERLLRERGGLTSLLTAASCGSALKGLGPAKRAELMAILEIARRAMAERLRARPVLSDAATVKQYAALHLRGSAQEQFAVIFLDSQHRLIATEVLFYGTLTQTAVYPREVVRRSLAHHAAALILAHNHPSGCAEPSRADEQLTDVLQHALGLIDVRVLDHIVVGAGEVVSMRERGCLG